MEHTSAIQYRESSLFLDKNATQLQELSRAKLIAHETAHMWFGNLVTMNWFNDVWMKEVFANFMADKIVNPLFSNINHDLQFLTAHYPRAFSVDRTKGSNAIRQELNNLENAGSLYGSIIYNKAPIMMRQLELLLGEESFRTGIQTYIKTYANKNVDWNDLVLILDKKTKLDLEQWSDVWVNSAEVVSLLYSKFISCLLIKNPLNNQGYILEIKTLSAMI
jgi:aminopeptidase N